MNMAEYGSQRWEQPENVNFESIIIGLKIDILLRPRVKSVSYVRFNCKRKKWEQNFHFVF